MQQSAEFFARLASKSPDEDFSSEELTTLVADCRQVCAAVGYPLDASSGITRGDLDEELERDEEAWESFLRATLQDLWLNIVWPILQDLFAGEPVALPAQTSVVYLEGRTLREESLAQQSADAAPLREFLVELFYTLLRLRPFPFGLCPVCQRVFVQPSRGKPRRYCSDACKQKGIPSAAKRSQYALAWRHRVRVQEIDATRRILQVWPEERQHWLRLRRAFPKKSRRQLLYIVKQANKATARKEE